ncbi:hypothetical protein ABZ725_51530 [Streptomyces sp. NPDC006872]|uniref:hypothetical protein n=1 Tax=Streptomyces sp. NPDC006872 TaxID=3155720 RepID=UPI0033F98C11
MRTRTAAAAIIAAIALTACSASEDVTGNDTATAKTSPTATASGITDEQKAAAREAAGLPPTPQPAEWAAYIKALDAIDADIVHGKEDKAISRGIDSCSGIKRYPDDKALQVKTTGSRFTSPDHPEGRDTATATKILAAAHKYICPDF